MNNDLDTKSREALLDEAERLRDALRDLRDDFRRFCEALIEIEREEWKPFQVFRTVEQVDRDEARHEMASEIADFAREALARIA